MNMFGFYIDNKYLRTNNYNEIKVKSMNNKRGYDLDTI